MGYDCSPYDLAQKLLKFVENFTLCIIILSNYDLYGSFYLITAKTE